MAHFNIANAQALQERRAHIFPPVSQSRRDETVTLHSQGLSRVQQDRQLSGVDLMGVWHPEMREVLTVANPARCKSAVPPSIGLITSTDRSDLGVDFKDIAIRVTKEQRAMAKRLVGWRINDHDSAFGKRCST
jgi:hypothetical protein